MKVIRTNSSHRICIIAVHIDQSLETILFPTVKQPVNRSLLIYLQMILIKILNKVIANHFTGRISFVAKCLRNKVKIFFQCIFPIHRFHKLYESSNNIIGEIFLIRNRDNVVTIRIIGAWLRAILCFDIKLSSRYIISGCASYSCAHSRSCCFKID